MLILDISNPLPEDIFIALKQCKLHMFILNSIFHPQTLFYLYNYIQKQHNIPLIFIKLINKHRIFHFY